MDEMGAVYKTTKLPRIVKRQERNNRAHGNRATGHPKS